MLAVQHIRKKDLVQVMTGREKGKTGKVLRVLTKKGAVVIEKLNMVKRHTKPAQNQPGGIIEKEAPLRASNILLYCEKCARGVRTGKKILEGGKKVRVCKRCHTQLDK
ncbi:MAG: 50S ribosomal protein L24 [Deltaproteobacteria bacterium]|nr:50S ribosomal protein L24 [Deltaproteobacteria bacterium]